MSKLWLTMACLFGVVAVPFASGSQGSDPGRKTEATACVACHSTRLIASQRLSAAAWAREVDKMIGWGAIVPDRQLLVDYLASEYSNSKPIPSPATSGNGVKP
jgi:hypothetical protein